MQRDQNPQKPSVGDFTMVFDPYDPLYQGEARLLTPTQVEGVANLLAGKPDGKYKKDDPMFREANLALGADIFKQGDNYFAIVPQHLAGAGTFGTVERAQNIRTDEWVVIKNMNIPKGMKLAEYNKNLKNEIKILKKVGVYVGAMNVQGGSPDQRIIIMKAVRGVSLAELMFNLKQNQASLHPSLALNIGATAFTQLAQLHDQAGVLHRDLQPNNILVDPSGGVKFVDFGEALDRKKEKDGVRIEREKAHGQYRYLSPEARGEPSKENPKECDFSTSTKSDVFMLGAALGVSLGFLKVSVANTAQFYSDVKKADGTESDLEKNCLIKDPIIRQAYRDLIQKMIHTHPADRCTAAEARDALIELQNRFANFPAKIGTFDVSRYQQAAPEEKRQMLNEVAGSTKLILFGASPPEPDFYRASADLQKLGITVGKVVLADNIAAARAEANNQVVLAVTPRAQAPAPARQEVAPAVSAPSVAAVGSTGEVHTATASTGSVMRRMSSNLESESPFAAAASPAPGDGIGPREPQRGVSFSRFMEAAMQKAGNVIGTVAEPIRKLISGRH